MENRSDRRSPNIRTSAVLAWVFCWLVVPPSSSPAVTYYVDANNPNARDTNPGTESQPFKTIGRTTGTVNAGDTVWIKAGIYRETVILSRSGSPPSLTSRVPTIGTPITFAAYPGHEGKAVISAAEPLTNWRPCAGPQECGGNPNWEHLYWADVATLVQSHPDTSFAVRQVFQQGKLLPRSRYPNIGWSYPTSMPDPMKRFADDTLFQPSGYFVGTICHLKTADWQIDQIPITGFSSKTITLSKSPRYEITTRYGYYLTNIVGEINAEGEWAYDATRKRIFLWPQGDVPEGVEFSYREYCIRSYWHTAWNVVRGLVLRGAYRDGLWLYQSQNMRLESNTIEYAFNYGIQVQATTATCDDNQILRNTIRYPASRGINIDSTSSRTNIEGNYIYATGTDAFGGDLMNGQSFAIYVSGPYTRLYNNRIDRTGYSAIYVSGKTLSRDISYNHVTRAGLALADAGCLYTGGYSDVAEKDHIHHNVFADSLGCLSMDRTRDTGQTPTPNIPSGLMHGIYVDEQGNNRVIEYNTVINCRSRGIFFHWAPSNVVQKNTLYGNQVAQIAFSGKNEARTALLNDTVVDNILFATSRTQRTFELTMNYDNVRFGQSDRNYFYNPYESAHIFVSRYPASGGVLEQRMTLDGWQSLSGYDRNSKEFSYLEQFNDLGLAYPTTARIVYNTTMEAMTVDLAGNQYYDVQGNRVSGAVVLQPFESKILIVLDSNGSPPPLP